MLMEIPNLITYKLRGIIDIVMIPSFRDPRLSVWRGLGETVMNRYGDLKRPQTGNGCYKTLHFYFMDVNALQY